MSAAERPAAEVQPESPREAPPDKMQAEAQPTRSLLDQVVQETQQRPTAMQFVGKLDEFWRLANMLANSGLVPYRKPEPCMAILLRAHELAIPTSMAFSLIYHFDGQTHMAASLLAALAIARCGVKYDVLTWDENLCRLHFTRPGWEPLEVEFTMTDAERAGLVGKVDEKTGFRVGKKDNWRAYPKAMLFARALAMGVRAIAPDYFAGEYAAEEFDVDTRKPPREMPAAAKQALQRAAGVDADGSARLNAATAEVSPQAGPHPLEAAVRRALQIAGLDTIRINRALAEAGEDITSLAWSVEEKRPEAWKQAMAEAEAAAAAASQQRGDAGLDLFGEAA